jgi:hypothetical protein
MEPTWHDGLSRTALVELVEGLTLAMDKAVPRLDAIAHHLGLMSQQGEEMEVLGGISDQIADIGDELYAASDRDKLREWGNQIDTPDKAREQVFAILKRQLAGLPMPYFVPTDKSLAMLPLTTSSDMVAPLSPQDAMKKKIEAKKKKVGK